MNMDGTGRAPLPTDTLAGLPTLCGKDGIAYIQLSDVTVDLWRMDLNGMNRRLIAKNGASPACSPDGKEVLFFNTLDQALYRISLPGGSPVLLSKPGEVLLSQAYSHDGKTIAYASFRKSEGGEGPVASSIVLMDAATHQQLRSIPVSSALPNIGINALTFAPDDSGLYFFNTPGSASNIWFQPLDGGAPKQVTQFTSDLISSFGWSPDGKTFAVSRQHQTWDGVLIRDLASPH